MFFIVFIGVSKKNMYCTIFSLTFFSIFLAFSQLFLALRLHRELESKAGKRTPKTRTLKKQTPIRLKTYHLYLIIFIIERSPF